MKVIFYRFVGFILNLLYFISPDGAAKTAIRLFSTPRSKRLSTERADFLDTAFKEELGYSEGHIMTYRWLGRKSYVLLIHGWESDASRWTNLAKLLLHEGYGVVALDAPAHGKSGFKTFNAFLYSEFIQVVCKKYNPNTIVAHSVGGFSAILADQRFNLSHIEKIVMLGSPYQFTTIYSRYIQLMGYTQQLIKKMDEHILYRFGNEPYQISIDNRLKENNFQYLIVHDSEDDIIPHSEAINNSFEMKNAKFVTTTGLGHSLENNSVYDSIIKFIANE